MASSAQEAQIGPAPRLPSYSVALVQSEIEMLNTPGNELSAFLLASRDFWRVEVFTERTFEGALVSTARFDCIIFGFNAIYQSEAIQTALAESFPETGILILHQLKESGFRFLPPELALQLSTISGSAPEAVIHSHTEPGDEILLNWPETVAQGAEELGRVSASAICHLEAVEVGLWRTSLEVVVEGTRRPVLLRTSALRTPRVVVCTLQLEPRKAMHARLLRNMITYCAAGWPEIAILTSADHRDGEIARRLRLQGANAIELPTAVNGWLNFEEWPLRGVHDVLVDEKWDAATVLRGEDARKWLELGNTLVQIEPGGLTFHHGASDAHVVAQRWSSWFHATESAAWHGGSDRHGESHAGTIFGTRAILRVLELLQREKTRAHPERIGLEPASHYAEPALELLRRRQQQQPSYEGTISTHAAARDVVRLIGADESARDIVDYLGPWLLAAFDDAAPEDQFDIARSLSDRDLFVIALGNARAQASPLSAALATRLREAAVACDGEAELPNEKLDELSSPELDNNLLLASEYVAARVALARKSKGHPAAQLDVDAMGRALATIGKFGLLARASATESRLTGTRVHSGEISTEAAALIAYYDSYPTSTNAIRREAQGVPPGVVGAVLQTSNRVRAAEAEALACRHELQQALAEREGELRRASNGFGLLSGAAAITILVVMVFILGFDLPNFASAFGIAVLVFILIALLLRSVGLAPTWASRVVQLLAGGFSGLGSALGGLFQERTKD